MLISQRPTLTEDFIDSSRSRFVIEPLEPGFGYTLGNSLRRTLLSSIPGAAVTSIRVDGVLHEFTTIPGVKEDVSDIILNIKGLVLSSDFDEPATVYLRREGGGAVTAADVECPAGVEIHNPDHHIATLNDSGRLDIEMVVERGRGYVPAQPNSGGEIGRIPVDQIYSPVLKVSYKVEATRVEQRTDFDKLVIDVETKNSITARDAMASAGKTLVELFGLARELNEAAEGIEIGPSPQQNEDIAAYSMPIEDLESRYYIRLEVKDQHGTLHAISEVFDDCGISIRTMSQSLLPDNRCELTFVTHTAREADVQRALNKLSQLSCLDNIGTLIRIEED